MRRKTFFLYEAESCSAFLFPCLKGANTTTTTEQPTTMDSSPTSSTQEPVRLAPFNPTCSHAQKVALEFLSLQENDVLFDLGCGDGKFLMAAAEQTPGLQCVGIEIDPIYTKRAADTLSSLPTEISCRVDIREGDVMKVFENDVLSSSLSLVRDATAVFVYLLPKGLKLITPKLQAISQQRQHEGRSFRVVSYMFKMPEWEPDEVDRTTKGDCPVYLYNLASNTSNKS